MIPLKSDTYDTRSTHSVDTYFSRKNTFKYAFFPHIIREWNKHDLQLRNAKHFKKFKHTLLKLARLTRDLIYGIHHSFGLNSFGLKLLTRLGLSHLNERRLKCNFKNGINPPCTSSLEVDSTNHFFLHCYYCSAIRISFFNGLNRISPQFYYFLKMCLSSTTFWQSNFWWKWLSKNTWNFNKIYFRVKKI